MSPRIRATLCATTNETLNISPPRNSRSDVIAKKLLFLALSSVLVLSARCVQAGSEALLVYQQLSDADGNTTASNIVRISPTGTQSIFASNVPPVNDMKEDSTGNVFISTEIRDSDGNVTSSQVLKFTPDGKQAGVVASINDGSEFAALAVDASNNVFAAASNDLSFPNYTGRILKITPTGAQTSFAQLSELVGGLAFGANGNLFATVQFAITDRFATGQIASSILEFTPAGAPSTFASVQYQPPPPGCDPFFCCGDYPAWRGIAVDSSGNVFVVQTESGCDAGGGAAILKFSPSGGTPTIFPANIDPNNFGAGAAIAFGSDGKLYVSNYSGFFAYALDGTRTVVASPKDGFHAFCFDKGSADLTVSLRRGASTSCFANATPAAGVDDALTPVSDPNVLDSQPVVTAGLVADGVTPLLIKFTPSSALPQPTQYKVTFGFPNGGSANVSAHLASLSGPFASGTITLSGSTPVWDYLSAFNPQDISFGPNSTQVDVQMTVQRADGTGSPTVTNFAIRKPPIVLVHGYNTDGGTWTNEFFGPLDVSRGSDFVQPITYEPQGINTPGRLDVLAHSLDNSLTSLIERPGAGLWKDWAFTRYDLVCHSQGGVLVRMLCTTFCPVITPANFGNGHPFSGAAFRSNANFYRGRFRRIVTLGSPQNGSVLPYYVDKLYASNGYEGIPPILQRMGVLQPKFNPFGDQIREINAPGTLVDPAAKFHVIRGLIGSGKPERGLFPPVYSLTGLSAFLPELGDTRGSVVIPNGSDAIVDWESATAGQVGEGAVVSTLIDTAHCGPLFIFGASNTETGSINSAASAIRALDSTDPSKFGPFIVPALLLDDRKEAIDKVIPDDVVRDIIVSLIHAEKALSATGTASSLSFTIDPSAIQQIADGVSWYAEVFGPNGVSSEGVTVTVDSSNSTKVVVSVDDSVQGDVVLYATYPTTDGKLVTSVPKLVVSHPVGPMLQSIELQPNAATIPIGGRLLLGVWGDYDNGNKAQLYIPPSAVPACASSNPSVASITGNDLITGANSGTATITCQYQTFTATASITVSAPSTKFDFNGDGSVDLLLVNATTRQTAVWNLNGTAFLSGGFGPGLPSGWALVSAADFNGDSKLDVVLFNTATRQTAVWYLNNISFVSGAYGPILPVGWSLSGVSDFDSDGHPDYVLFNPATRQSAVWYLNGTTFAHGAYGPTLPAGWSLADANDFNADGKPDFVLTNTSTRQTAIWYLAGTAFTSGAFGPTLPVGWTLPGTADFTLDGKPDYALFNPSTRQTAIWFLNGTSYVSGVFGPTLPAGWTLISP